MILRRFAVILSQLMPLCGLAIPCFAGSAAIQEAEGGAAISLAIDPRGGVAPALSNVSGSRLFQPIVLTAEGQVRESIEIGVVGDLPGRLLSHWIDENGILRACVYTDNGVTMQQWKEKSPGGIWSIIGKPILADEAVDSIARAVNKVAVLFESKRLFLIDGVTGEVREIALPEGFARGGKAMVALSHELRFILVDRDRKLWSKKSNEGWVRLQSPLPGDKAEDGSQDNPEVHFTIEQIVLGPGEMLGVLQSWQWPGIPRPSHSVVCLRDLRAGAQGSWIFYPIKEGAPLRLIEGGTQLGLLLDNGALLGLQRGQWRHLGELFARDQYDAEDVDVVGRQEDFYAISALGEIAAYMQGTMRRCNVTPYDERLLSAVALDGVVFEGGGEGVQNGDSQCVLLFPRGLLRTGSKSVVLSKDYRNIAWVDGETAILYGGARGSTLFLHRVAVELDTKRLDGVVVSGFVGVGAGGPIVYGWKANAELLWGLGGWSRNKAWSSLDSRELSFAPPRGVAWGVWQLARESLEWRQVCEIRDGAIVGAGMIAPNAIGLVTESGEWRIEKLGDREAEEFADQTQMVFRTEPDLRRSWRQARVMVDGAKVVVSLMCANSSEEFYWLSEDGGESWCYSSLIAKAGWSIYREGSGQWLRVSSEGVERLSFMELDVSGAGERISNARVLWSVSASDNAVLCGLEGGKGIVLYSDRSRPMEVSLKYR